MNNYGLSSSFTPTSSSSPIYSLINHNHTIISPKSKFSSLLKANYPHNLPNYAQFSLSYPSQSLRPVFCNSSFGPDEGDNRTVLDAFFLGKALGEALTERVESVVGELLSTVGRLQAEQQKQIQEFQEDVLERAKTAKDNAAREALEAQGRLTPTSTTKNADVTSFGNVRTVPPRNESNDYVNSTTVVKTNGPASSVDEDSPYGIQIDE